MFHIPRRRIGANLGTTRKAFHFPMPHATLVPAALWRRSKLSYRPHFVQSAPGAVLRQAVAHRQAFLLPRGCPHHVYLYCVETPDFAQDGWIQIRRSALRHYCPSLTINPALPTMSKHVHTPKKPAKLEREPRTKPMCCHCRNAKKRVSNTAVSQHAVY